MNDRFKFRVWKKAENKMVEGVTYLNPLLLDEEIAPDEAKNYIIMQSTGHKDKNDKLIYENDFVKNFDNQVYQVFWISDAACFMVLNIETKAILGIYSLISFKKDLEVIGNIYENKDLLND